MAAAVVGQKCNNGVLYPSNDASSSVRKKYLKRKSQKYRRSKKRRKALKETVTQSPSLPHGQPMYSSWFWRNYRNAMEWQGRHQIAYWRSRTVALEHENGLLHEYIRNLSVRGNIFVNSGIFNGEYSHDTLGQGQEIIVNKNLDFKNIQQFDGEDEEDCDEHNDEGTLEFEITEELLDFFEQSTRHKIELERQRQEEREKESSQDEDRDADGSTLPPKRQVGQQRLEEMTLLYGKAAPMILGMETAMQLSYDRNCDLKQPTLWPNIPLKL